MWWLEPEWSDWRQTINSVRRFIAKPRRVRRAAITAALVAPIVKWNIRHRSYADTVRRLGNRPRPPTDGVPEAAAVARAARAAMRRLPIGLSCLDISVVVWWLVGGSEVAEVRLGVKPDDGSGLNFHAWVEVDGVVINDRPAVGSLYRTFVAPPPPTARFD